MPLEMVTANTKAGTVRREMLEGKMHVVVPCVMMTSGVVTGSHGSLLYPDSEMKKNVQAWNNRPVVVYHPTKDGKPSTAGDPNVLNTQKVGTVLNAEYNATPGKKSRWKSEAWINEELGNSLMPEVMEKINKGEMVEVSTGLHTENEKKAGVHNGKSYSAIAKNYVPDHLAILPTGVGACSIKDGAGLLQNASCGPKCSECGGGMTCPECSKGTTENQGVTTNAISYGRVHQTIQKNLDDKFGPYRANVQDVYPGFVVYARRSEDGNTKMFRHDYKMDKTAKGGVDSIELTGESSSVDRITEYRTPDGKFVGNSLYGGKPPEQENNVNKDQKIAAIIANSGGQLDEADREWLAKKSEAWLNTLPGAVAAAVVTTPIPTPTPVANKQPTFQELLSNASPEQQEAWNEAMQARELERGKLVAVITANSKNKFSPEQLREMKLPALRNLAELASPDITNNSFQPVANYGGAAGFVPPVVVNGAPEIAPVLPLPGSTRPVKK